MLALVGLSRSGCVRYFRWLGKVKNCEEGQCGCFILHRAGLHFRSLGLLLTASGSKGGGFGAFF